MVKKHGRRWTNHWGVALLAGALAGCSFVDSSTSISNSVSASFRSSSSSSPGSSEEAYRDDVRDYAYSQVRAKQGAESLLRGIPPLAQRYGISNWEGDSATWVGLGEGLAKAQVSLVQLETYKQDLAGTDVNRKAEIQRGFDAFGAD